MPTSALHSFSPLLLPISKSEQYHYPTNSPYLNSMSRALGVALSQIRFFLDGSDSDNYRCAAQSNCVDLHVATLIIGAHVRHLHKMLDLATGVGFYSGSYFYFLEIPYGIPSSFRVLLVLTASLL